MGFWDNVTAQNIESAQERGFAEFKIGENRAWIAGATEKVSQNGNPMLEITFTNDKGAQIRWYIVDGEYKLSKLKNLYTSFGIPFSENNYQRWIGKMGLVVVRAGKEYNGIVRNEVSHVRSAKDVPADQIARGTQPPAQKQVPQQPRQQAHPVNETRIQEEKTVTKEDQFDDDIPWDDNQPDIW
jgi:hypothetical protein